MRSREICNACQRPSPVGFSVPDEVWAACVPRRFIHSPLCVMCFARYGDEAGVAWDRQIEFFPVSLTTHHWLDTISEEEQMQHFAKLGALQADSDKHDDE